MWTIRTLTNLLNALDKEYYGKVKELEKALKNGDSIIPHIGNSMEPAAISLLPDILKVKEELLEKGAPFALMSGSGSSIFTMSKDYEVIKNLYNPLNNEGYFVRHTKLLKKV